MFSDLLNYHIYYFEGGGAVTVASYLVCALISSLLALIGGKIGNRLEDEDFHTTLGFLFFVVFCSFIPFIQLLVFLCVFGAWILLIIYGMCKFPQTELGERLRKRY